VERREARRSALWIGRSLPLKGQARNKSGHDERWILAKRTRDRILAKRTRGGWATLMRSVAGRQQTAAGNSKGERDGARQS